MKLKRLAALLLVMVMALGLLTGCIGDIYEYALSIDGTDISSGLYLMAQFTAYSEARNKVEDSDNVLKERIEEQSATDWIRARAEELCRRYVAVQRLAREKKITLSSEGQQNAESLMQYWEYMEEMYTENGISKSTVQRYNNNGELANDLFKALYAEGGELYTPDEELKAEYAEKYAHIRFFSVPTAKLAAEGEEEATDMTAEVTEITDKLVTELKGGKTLEDVAKSGQPLVYSLLEREFDPETATDGISDSYTDLYPEDFETYSEEFLTELKNQAIGDFGSYNMGATIILYEKVEMFADDEAWETRRDTVIQSLKQEEFEDYLRSIYEGYAVNWVFGAKTHLRPGKIVY